VGEDVVGEAVQSPGEVSVVEAIGERDGEVGEWFATFGRRPKSRLVEFGHMACPTEVRDILADANRAAMNY
jgi:hypothetical protein